MRPHLTAAEVAQIELQLAGLSSLLEFGCGEATLVAARQVRRIVSVDSDPARLHAVQGEVAREAVEFTPVHIDIGPVGEGGHPAGESRIRDWPRYHTHIWRGLGGSPDAVAIAGRFRVACLLQAIIHCKPDCVFLFHDLDARPPYRKVLRHVDVLTRVGRIGVLRTRQQVDGTAVLHDLFDHYLDPD
ncbi:conserved protein of unknown function [uncultured Sphingopyxis sp.]|uniref:Class I SAM-dependent methyltransferase n=1 Tax=uncultured Sphingopyxis sp. TaxID=310581 RepID=A0A1Y5PNS5_9SPHN|nr:hypothetical protein [uncultured Sphingopyxis sp.]SBV31611.1 conserved protein of unknown function [uncultured Sphingopyxis sp.]